MDPPLNDPNWMRAALGQQVTWEGPCRLAGYLLYDHAGDLLFWREYEAPWDVPACAGATLHAPSLEEFLSLCLTF